MPKNILITGGAGFIGSNLCSKLLNNYNVYILDNFNSFYNPLIKRDNIQRLKKIPSISDIKFEVIEVDIRDKEAIKEVFSKVDIDLVIHLAAMAGVRPSINNTELYYDVNIMGTLNLLEQSRLHSVKKFIFASSSSVYGNNSKSMFSESDIVDNPISPYAATKKSGELLCHTYHHLHDMSIICLRFFTVYGPGQRPDLAIHKFTKKILNDEVITIYGEGCTERDYTYIDDIIQGIQKSIDFLNDNSKVYEIFNLGECNTISLNKLVKTIESVCNRAAKIKRVPMQPGDVLRTCADITKAVNILGYKPNTSFEDGISNFVNWYREVNSLQ